MHNVRALQENSPQKPRGTPSSTGKRKKDSSESLNVKRKRQDQDEDEEIVPETGQSPTPLIINLKTGLGSGKNGGARSSQTTSPIQQDKEYLLRAEDDDDALSGDYSFAMKNNPGYERPDVHSPESPPPPGMVKSHDFFQILTVCTGISQSKG